jgi:Trehalose utilisation
MMLALTYGAAPSIAVGQPARLQQELYNCLDEVQRRKPWLSHKRPERWAALVMSDNTRNFYGRSAGAVEERYLASVFGTFRAAVEEHLPMTVINDWNLNAADLAGYRVLVLPNTACLDDAQVAAVEQYVREGGGLVASLDVSLFDEFGNPRENFALAQVLGIDYRGLPESSVADSAAQEELDVNFARSIGPDYWEKRKNVFDFQQDPESLLNRGKMKTYVGAESVTFKGPALRVAPRGDAAATIATLRAKTAGAAAFPGVVTRAYGKGRVAYFAAGLDAGYYLYAYPYQRLALAHAITWAAGAGPPVEVEAPMCVHATLMRQTKDGQRLLVHLFNDVNTTAQHALPTDDVPLREEALPIHDLRVTFGPEYRFARIHLEPEGRTLAMERGASGTTVVVPRLDVHAIVVGELAEGPRGAGR